MVVGGDGRMIVLIFGDDTAPFLARDCVLAIRGSVTLSASCSLLPFAVLADDRDGDADE